MERFQLVSVTSELCEKITEFTYDHFFPRSPLSLAAGRGKARDLHYEEDMRRQLSFGLSLAAIDKESGQLVGIAVNTVLKKTDSVHDYSKMTSEEQNIHRLLHELEEGIDVFKMFQSDEALELYFLGVHTDFGGLGIARALLEETIDLARRHGFKLIRSFPSHPITMRMFDKTGFQTLNKIKLCDFVKTNGEAYFPHAKPEDSATFCVKPL